jgi:predicted acylesterase/phospholipase RssA
VRPLQPALLASAALPGLFRDPPHGRSVDGAVVDTVPWHAWRGRSTRIYVLNVAATSPPVAAIDVAIRLRDQSQQRSTSTCAVPEGATWWCSPPRRRRASSASDPADVEKFTTSPTGARASRPARTAATAAPVMACGWVDAVLTTGTGP